MRSRYSFLHFWVQAQPFCTYILRIFVKPVMVATDFFLYRPPVYFFCLLGFCWQFHVGWWSRTYLGLIRLGNYFYFYSDYIPFPHLSGRLQYYPDWPLSVIPHHCDATSASPPSNPHRVINTPVLCPMYTDRDQLYGTRRLAWGSGEINGRAMSRTHLPPFSIGCHWSYREWVNNLNPSFLEGSLSRIPLRIRWSENFDLT